MKVDAEEIDRVVGRFATGLRIGLAPELFPGLYAPPDTEPKQTDADGQKEGNDKAQGEAQGDGADGAAAARRKKKKKADDEDGPDLEAIALEAKRAAEAMARELALGRKRALKDRPVDAVQFILAFRDLF